MTLSKMANEGLTLAVHLQLPQIAVQLVRVMKLPKLAIRVWALAVYLWLADQEYDVSCLPVVGGSGI